jgi:hypothetical protein
LLIFPHPLSFPLPAPIFLHFSSHFFPFPSLFLCSISFLLVFLILFHLPFLPVSLHLQLSFAFPNPFALPVTLPAYFRSLCLSCFLLLLLSLYTSFATSLPLSPTFFLFLLPSRFTTPRPSGFSPAFFPFPLSLSLPLSPSVPLQLPLFIGFLPCSPCASLPHLLFQLAVNNKLPIIPITDYCLSQIIHYFFGIDQEALQLI